MSPTSDPCIGTGSRTRARSHGRRNRSRLPSTTPGARPRTWVSSAPLSAPPGAHDQDDVVLFHDDRELVDDVGARDEPGRALAGLVELSPDLRSLLELNREASRSNPTRV